MRAIYLGVYLTSPGSPDSTRWKKEKKVSARNQSSPRHYHLVKHQGYTQHFMLAYRVYFNHQKRSIKCQMFRCVYGAGGHIFQGRLKLAILVPVLVVSCQLVRSWTGVKDGNTSPAVIVSVSD